MPSLSDFGLGSESPASERRRRLRDTEEESGARPLPSEAYELDDVDERVVLPKRNDAPLFFGIGAGLGVAVLAIAAVLYFGGYLGGPKLGPAPEATPLAPETALAPFEEARNGEALAAARVAITNLSAPPPVAVPATAESQDVTATDEPAAEPAPPPEPRTPRQPKNLTDELEALDRAQPTPMPSPTEPELPPPAQPTAPAETSPPSEPSPP